MTNPQHRADRDIAAATDATLADDESTSVYEMQERMNQLSQHEQVLAGVQDALVDTDRAIVGNLDSGPSASSAQLTGPGLQDMLDPLRLQEQMDRHSQGEESTAGAQKVGQDTADAIIGKIAAEESEPSTEAGAQSVALHDLPMFEPVQDVGLNPQPEPPSTPDVESLHEVSILPPIADVGLNPQPEPPSAQIDLSVQDVAVLQPVDVVGLNPQPEPPSEPDYASVQDISTIEPIDMSEQVFIDPPL
jgi:hypothetical protein